MSAKQWPRKALDLLAIPRRSKFDVPVPLMFRSGDKVPAMTCCSWSAFKAGCAMVIDPFVCAAPANH